MEYLKSYQSYSQDEMIVEGLNLRPLFIQLKNSLNKKTVANLIIGSLMTIMATNQVLTFIENNKEIPEVDKIVLVDTVSKYKNPQTLRLSSNGWDHIKESEGLRLKAYKIGDGMITVGYGHAERIRNSKLRAGQKITQEQAMQYLIKDVNVAAQGIKRMFKQWEEDGVKMQITQNQYDALVSMAFNMGVSGLRQTEFAEHLKNKDFEKAAHTIKVTGVSDKFPGLAKRRMKEFRMFVSG